MRREPNITTPDTKTEGDGSNSNDKLYVSPTILPKGDPSKIVVDKTMATVVLTKLECNTNSKETAEIVAVF